MSWRVWRRGTAAVGWSAGVRQAGPAYVIRKTRARRQCAGPRVGGSPCGGVTSRAKFESPRISTKSASRPPAQEPSTQDGHACTSDASRFPPATGRWWPPSAVPPPSSTPCATDHAPDTRLTRRSRAWCAVSHVARLAPGVHRACCILSMPVCGRLSCHDDSNNHQNGTTTLESTTISQNYVWGLGANRRPIIPVADAS